MGTETTHQTVYVGSEVNAHYLQDILNKTEIRSFIRDESGLGSSFPVGWPPQYNLSVESNHYEEAKKIADATFPQED